MLFALQKESLIHYKGDTLDVSYFQENFNLHDRSGKILYTINMKGLTKGIDNRLEKFELISLKLSLMGRFGQRIALRRYYQKYSNVITSK